MATLAPRWLVFSSVLVLAPLWACTLQLPDDPAKVRHPSCEKGKILVANPDGWGCVLPGALGATEVAEAAHARSAEVVESAPAAAHALVAAVARGLKPTSQVALGFDGTPAASLDLRGGGIQVDGSPVPATLGTFFLSNPPAAVPPGASATADFPAPFTVTRTGTLHVRASGTLASTTAADSPVAASPLATCAVALSAVGPNNATDVFRLGLANVSAFQSAAQALPSSWYVEGETSNVTLAPGSYRLQIEVTNVSIATGAPCVLQEAKALLSFY